jgi:phosphoglucosamine mutase
MESEVAQTLERSPAVVMQVAAAAGHVFRKSSHRSRAVVGKDTRLSCYMIESAIVAGLTSVGVLWTYHLV